MKVCQSPLETEGAEEETGVFPWIGVNWMAVGLAVTAGREEVVSVGAVSVNRPSGATLAILGLSRGTSFPASDALDRGAQPAIRIPSRVTVSRYFMFHL